MGDNAGVHHIGLATHDMDATLDFYENVLGFPAVVCEMIAPEVPYVGSSEVLAVVGVCLGGKWTESGGVLSAA